jgi:arylsulfatase A-like enzyme
MFRRSTVLIFLLALFVALFSQCHRTDRPLNVLFIAVDDLNADLGCYGHTLVKSPNIDRLASEGIRFNRAYCQYPVCNPSRSSLLTGMYPEHAGVLSNGNNFRKKLPDVLTLPQLFKENGYITARVGKIFHYGVPLQIGTNGMDDSLSWHEVVNPRGIDREVHDRIHTLEPGRFGGTLSWLKLDSDDEQHTDGIGATEAVRLLEKLNPEKTGQPFFLAVGFYRPHTPFVAPATYFDLYPKEAIQPAMLQPGDRDDIPVAALRDRPHQLELDMEQRREIIRAYYASISFMDAQVGRLLDALQRLAVDKNTVVVFFSDHGYHLGQHGLWQKGDLFEGSVRAPLILKTPALRQRGQATEAIVEFVDIYPTLTELCGLPTPASVMGESLVPVIDDPQHAGKQAAFSQAWSGAQRTRPELRNWRVMGYSIRTERYRYTEWENGEHGRELYDYLDDPGELNNLATHPAFTQSDTMRQLEQLLSETKKRTTLISIHKTLQPLIEEHGVEYAIREFHRLKQNRSETYNFSEEELNALGYELLENGDAAAAIKVLTLNQEQYPYSANTYDNLAAVYQETGDKTRAQQFARKTLEMIPKDPFATAAQKNRLRERAQKKLADLLR